METNKPKNKPANLTIPQETSYSVHSSDRVTLKFFKLNIWCDLLIVSKLISRLFNFENFVHDDSLSASGNQRLSLCEVLIYLKTEKNQKVSLKNLVKLDELSCIKVFPLFLQFLTAFFVEK